MKTIGVIGMGIIGCAWAHRYSVAGQLAGTWNRTARPKSPAWKASAGEVAEEADVIQIVVADPPAVEGVLMQILPRLRSGKSVVQSSTIDPLSSTRFQALVRSTGAAYIEAPFTGSKPAAEEGKMIFFLGGNEGEIRDIEPLLCLISETRLHIGTGEQAAALKLSMNLNLAALMEAYAESLSLARRAGISDGVYFRALAQNASYSGLAKMKEPKLKAGDFAPQFSVKHMAKDMRLASSSATGADYPVLKAVCKRLKEAEASGYGDLDFCALIKLLQP
jgi:3-hydroxyisobutyrate dehydrogenase-like beta-hydroxyacid dehydrogenase